MSETDGSNPPAQDAQWMRLALAAAEQAAAAGEVPVGAVLVADGQLVATGHNCPIGSCDPTAHAEVVALRQAAAQAHNYRLPGTTLYVTIEPCTMCIGAMMHARVERLVFGAREPRAGAVVSAASLAQGEWFNHRLAVTEGVLAAECADQLTRFFRARRAAVRAQRSAVIGAADGGSSDEGLSE